MPHDKVHTEVVAPIAGVLARILVQVNESVAVGDPVAELDLDSIQGSGRGGRIRKAAGGTLSERRVYAQIAPTPPLEELDAGYTKVGYGPDGCTLDAEGCAWCGDSLHQRIARVAPGGKIVEEFPLPEEGMSIYAAMPGGEDGRTLLMCVAPDCA